LTYTFEDFSLDADRRELRRGTDLITVEPQVFDLLEYLVRNRERLVSKDDLFVGVWGGRIVSDSTLSSQITAARQAIGDSGEQQRLIRTVPRKGFRFVGAVRTQTQHCQDRNETESGGHEENGAPYLESATLILPGKPSIAVLPFTNLSGDPDQEYFADGITEDIITALSQFRWFFVIARGSSFTYKGRTIDPKQVGRELGVRYVLEGSIRKVAQRVRISGELIDASTGVNLWADRFDAPNENIFDLQDQITARVIGEIGPKLEQVEIERVNRKPTRNLDAYDYYLRGMGSLYRWTADGISEALDLFRKAIEVDPQFALGYGMAAYCYVQRQSYGLFTDFAQEIAYAEQLARRAAELGKDDATALSRAAHAIAAVVGDVENGAAWIDRALILNPNLCVGWYVSGWIRIFLGQPAEAIDHLTRAMRLSPCDPLIFRVHSAIAYAHFFANRYDEASTRAEKAIGVSPNYLTGVRVAAASYALTGRLDAAQKLMMHMGKLMPALRISNLKFQFPLRRPKDFTTWADALRKAGLPE